MKRKKCRSCNGTGRNLAGIAAESYQQCDDCDGEGYVSNEARPAKEVKKEYEKLEITLEDLVNAVQYGFDYRENNMNDGISVPIGNTFQWLMGEHGLVEVPQEMLDYRKKLEEEADRDSWKPGDVVNIENEQGTSFAWTNGLYGIIKISADDTIYLCRIGKTGELNKINGKYSCMCTGLWNDNLHRTTMTFKMETECI